MHLVVNWFRPQGYQLRISPPPPKEKKLCGDVSIFLCDLLLVEEGTQGSTRWSEYNSILGSL